MRRTLSIQASSSPLRSMSLDVPLRAAVASNSCKKVSGPERTMRAMEQRSVRSQGVSYIHPSRHSRHHTSSHTWSR